MSLESERRRPGRRHIWLAELTVPRCVLVSGVGACSSTATGDDKCYNTEKTCNVPNDIQLSGTKVYKFAQACDDMPLGEGWIPSLLSVTVTPGQLRIGGGLGSRSVISLTFADHPHSDIGVDPYRSERTWDPFFRGSFWPKWRARNFYQGQRLRVWSGYLAADNDLDSFDYANAQSMDFLIESVTQPSNGQVTITGKDPLKAADDDRSLAPRPNSGRLKNSITAAVGQVITLDPPGIGNEEYPIAGIVKIGSDECAVFTRFGDIMTLVDRGILGTSAIPHNAESAVQICLSLQAKTVAEIAETLLVDYADTDPSFIPRPDWDAEVNAFMPALYDLFVTTPTSVKKLIEALGTEAPCDLIWDERTSKVRLIAVKGAPSSAPLWTDDVTFLSSDVGVSELPDSRVSVVIIRFDIVNPVADLDDPNNYRQTYVLGDVDSARRYGGHRIREINSRFLSSTNRAGAEYAAQVLVGRFKDVPRQIEATLAPKDADTWTGDAVFVEHHKMQDATGAIAREAFQVISVQEQGDLMRYRALEWFNPPDTTAEFPIILSASYLNLRGPSEMGFPPLTLRDLFDLRFGVQPDSRTVRVRIEPGAVNGSESTGIAGLQILADEWPPETPIIIEIMGNGNVNDTVNNGYFVGAGGTGGTGRTTSAARHGRDGGPAMKITRPITLIHHGVIGGGAGGGGGNGYQSGGRSFGGGGGAGRSAGAGGPAPIPQNGVPAPGQPGSLIAGGNGGGSVVVGGGRGGNLGEDGLPAPNTGGDNIYRGSGGAAGVAIDGWSFVTLDPASTGVILGQTIN